MAAVLVKACFLLVVAKAANPGICPPGTSDHECRSDQAALLQKHVAVTSVANEPDSCEDKDRGCTDWAAAGQCGVNPGWMWLNCPLSCGKCAHSDGTEVATTFPGVLAALGNWEQPRNKVMLVSALVLNAVIALCLITCCINSCCAYTVNAALNLDDGQLQSWIVPLSRVQLNWKSPAETANSTETMSGPGGTGAPAEASQDTPNSSDSEGHRCRGFQSPSAWRDPTVDLNVEDTSFESWNKRRRSDALRPLFGCAVMTAVLLTIEVSVGIYLDSLALMSNGFHLLTDVAMYASLFAAVYISDRPGERSGYSYGLHRLEVVGVLIALISQYVVTGNLVYSAVRRVMHPHQMIEGAGKIICLTAVGSIIVNSSLACWLGRTMKAHNHSHCHGGMAGQMAWIHLVCDALENFMVILTGGLLWINPNLYFLDTFCTFAFALLVVGSTFGFLCQLFGVVMERAPLDVDCEKMFQDLEAIKGVISAHCCHAWCITPDKIAVTAHLYIESGTHEEVLMQANIVLKHRYGIHHTTLQVSEDEEL